MEMYNIIKSKRTLLTILLGSALLIAVVTAIAVSSDVSAQLTVGIDAAGKGDGLAKTATPDTIIENIVNIFLYVIGVVAVIMIIFSGFQYLTSAGDATKAKKAQTTLLYAVIGLIVAVFALAIVNFVVDSIGVGA